MFFLLAHSCIYIINEKRMIKEIFNKKYSHTKFKPLGIKVISLLLKQLAGRKWHVVFLALSHTRSL